MIDTGALTDGLLETLSQASGQLLGDGYRPEGSGWLDGQPNVGVFVPYGTLFFQGGSPRDATLRFDELVRGWSTNWLLSYFGGSRKQCDWVAKQFRDTYGVLMKRKFGAYTVMGASVRTVGTMERRDEVDPPLWSVRDTLVLYCDA